jgi:hypothetical protein
MEKENGINPSMLKGSGFIDMKVDMMTDTPTSVSPPLPKGNAGAIPPFDEATKCCAQCGRPLAVKQQHYWLDFGYAELAICSNRCEHLIHQTMKDGLTLYKHGILWKQAPQGTLGPVVAGPTPTKMRPIGAIKEVIG